jgi:rubrerythrin/ribosomal protein L40E
MAQEQLQRVQELIAAGRYEEARTLLQTIDRPEVPQLLALIDQMQQTAHQAQAEPAEATPTAEPPTPIEPEAEASGGLLDRLNAVHAAAEAEPPAEDEAERPVVRVEDGKRIHDAGTYQMLWDCQYCGTTKLLGKTHRYCPNCGAAQEPDARYYPADDEKIAVEDHEYVGADVVCPNCDALNSGAAEYCGMCGAPLSEGARARTLEAQTRASGQAFMSSGSRDVEQEEFDAEMERVGVKPKEGAKPGTPKWLLGVILLAVVACIGLIVIFTRTSEASVVLAGHSWEREIAVEQYAPIEDDAWCDSMPSGAYNISRQEEIRDYRQVADGEDCTTRRVDQGDGTFREEEVCETRYRDEPVYDTHCYYTVNQWVTERTALSSGDNQGILPIWPEANLNCAGTQRVGCEREANRTEHYILHLRNPESGADYTCEVDLDVWQAAEVDSRWNLEVGAVDGAARCNTLAPIE